MSTFVNKIYCLLLAFLLIFFNAITANALDAKGSSGKAPPVVITSGSIGGVYYASANSICRLLNMSRKSTGIRCVVQSSSGSVANINNIRDLTAQIGIVQSDWQEHAYNGTSVFAEYKAFEDLRFLFSLHDEVFTVIVRSNSSIESFDDIVGKTVNIGQKDSGVRSTIEEIMRVKGWTYDSFGNSSEFNDIEQARNLCDGKIDVMMIISGHPSSALELASKTCDVKILPVDDEKIHKFVSSNPEYSVSVIPGGMYLGSPNDINSFGVRATVVTSANTDAKVTYQITKLLFNNLSKFKKLHPAFANLDKKTMISSGKIAPYHAGAEKFYKEQGLS